MAKQAERRTQKVQQAREDAARQEARRRRVVLTVGGLVIVGLVAAIVWAVVRASSDPEAPAAGAEVVAPANLGPSGAITVGASDAAVTVRVYYDYMCPACGMFEAANGEELKRLVDDGQATLELWPISFLDEQSSGTQYSTRAANAIATVTDGAPDAAWAMHSALYANQPEEGTEGLTDDQIADVASSAGVPDEVVDRFPDGEFRPWVEEMTQEAFGAGVTGTPTVLIDGEAFEGDLYTTGPLTQAIESAAGG